MNKKLDNILCEKYPKIFVNRHNNSSCMSRGFECDDGWFNLIDKLCHCIQFNVDWNNTPQVIADQVKEKFGGLTCYFDNDDDYVRGLVDMAHVISLNICEMCGINENVCLHKNSYGTMKTLCNLCSEDLNFLEKVENF